MFVFTSRIKSLSRQRVPLLSEVLAFRRVVFFPFGSAAVVALNVILFRQAAAAPVSGCTQLEWGEEGRRAHTLARKVKKRGVRKGGGAKQCKQRGRRPVW